MKRVSFFRRCEICGGRRVYDVRPGQAVFWFPRKDAVRTESEDDEPSEEAEDSRDRPCGIYPGINGDPSVAVVYEPEQATG